MSITAGAIQRILNDEKDFKPVLQVRSMSQNIIVVMMILLCFIDI